MVPGYRDVRQLGEGRTGRVFLSTYQATGAHVAIKYLNATLRRDDAFMARFAEDAAILVDLDDPGVARTYEYVRTGSRAAVVTELVDGVSLRAILAEHGRVRPEAALALVKAVLGGLAAAHERGLAHRDVQPGNVLVQADGAVKLTDFGVVAHAEEPGVPPGSPPYMSPELWTRGEAGPPADLYATACVLFEAVRGRVPYRGDGVPALRDRHLVEPVPLEVAPDSLRNLLRLGLAKDPAARFASARRFAAELERDALTAYGPEWEKRGRRHLGELATLLALRFPLADAAPAARPRAEATARSSPAASPTGDAPRSSRAARRGRGTAWAAGVPTHLWLAGATVVAVAVTLLMAEGRVPPGAVLLPPDDTPSALDPVTTPDRRDPPGTPPPGTAPPADRRATRTPTPTPERTPPPTPTPRAPTATASTVRPSAEPTPPPTRPPAPPSVREAGVLAWDGSAGSVRVLADGPGPVRLRIAYLRRENGGEAREVGQETRTLTGRTAYTAQVGRTPAAVPCGDRAYLAILAMTEPAAANGPQIREVPVDGPPCPTRTPATPSPSSATTHPTPEAAPATG
ncbi:serine/threonine-protein kinase [Nonomuraea sp. NPDC023979]|uniref:serine/threonine-protein kinase n=1 Tax=Nonomuraea sp. NPDC023979 TaxID=3154796 RepID=UPI00340BF963